jgi:hypothetical protein
LLRNRVAVSVRVKLNQYVAKARDVAVSFALGLDGIDPDKEAVAVVRINIRNRALASFV